MYALRLVVSFQIVFACSYDNFLIIYSKVMLFLVIWISIPTVVSALHVAHLLLGQVQNTLRSQAQVTGHCFTMNTKTTLTLYQC